jgi:hypothetical protein
MFYGGGVACKGRDFRQYAARKNLAAAALLFFLGSGIGFTNSAELMKLFFGNHLLKTQKGGHQRFHRFFLEGILFVDELIYLGNVGGIFPHLCHNIHGAYFYFRPRLDKIFFCGYLQIFDLTKDLIGKTQFRFIFQNTVRGAKKFAV